MDNPAMNQSKLEEKKCGWRKERESVRVTVDFVLTFNFWLDDNHYYIIKIMNPIKKFYLKPPLYEKRF